MNGPSRGGGAVSHDRLLASVLDGISRPVIVRDDQLRYVWANEAGCAFLGRPLEDLRRRTAYDISLATEVDAFSRIDRAVLQSGVPNLNEEDLTMPDGSVRRFEVYKWRLSLGDGCQQLLVAEITDMTDLRAAEHKLRASEEHHRALLELQPHILWTADAAGNVEITSPGWQHLTGLPAVRGTGGAWLAAIDRRDRDMVVTRWQQAIRQGTPLDVEHRIITAEGKPRWFRTRANPRRDEAGIVLRWYGVTEDITDRRNALDRLRESETRFRAMANNAPAMIWTTDTEGRSTFFSRGWLTLTGTTEQECLGHGWLDFVHPDDRQAVEDEFAAALAAHAPLRAEYRLRRADGSHAWVIDHSVPRFGEDGAFLGYVGSALEITEKHEAEEIARETQSLITSLFDSLPDGLRLTDFDGRLILSNRAAQGMLGDAASVPGATAAERVGPANWARIRSHAAEVRRGRTSRLDIALPSADGTHIPMELILAPVRHGKDAPGRFISIWRDVTEITAARARAEEAAGRLSLVLESMIEGVLVVDRNWRLTYYNQNARSLLRKDIQIGNSLAELFPRGFGGAFDRRFREVMTTRIAQSFEARLDALAIWLAVRVSPTGDGLTILFRDITERRRAEQNSVQAQRQIMHMSRHDALTDLPNRVQFREKLDRALQTGAQPAVLSVDLDGFKSVNDAYGHPVGDSLLRKVAMRLRSCVRSGDTVARLGGDEFSIVLPRTTSQEATVALAQRIVEVLSDPFDLGGLEVAVGASVGIAFAADVAHSADELIKGADIALYRAKLSGRGTWCRFTPGMEGELRARQELRTALRRAFGTDELALHYQPLVNLRAGTISSFEALLRWRHPEFGMVSPADFIPVAEESGLIKPIGAWVLRTACAEAAGWPEPIGVAVNLSVLQFRSGGLAQIVREALDHSGLVPARLQLEITESVLLDDNGANIRTLRDLRDMGVRITMDDFGTGYSSLSYLRQFPFDKIKVDRSFVSELPEGRESMAVIRAVAGLGRSLGIVTTVEGVETELQLATVTAEGFDEAQGFFFSQPIPADQVRRTLAALGIL
ncbi:EAL domain-containing protein [Halodurantibacterium flavum]|uniref:EAL domain-containing protein n=1 Tax=Halodurantibacterium flavum TaxID=1382802 RepID=A0ABW4S5Y3_9RHOB